MAGKIDKVKCQVEEVVRVLANNKKLQSKGKADRRVGKAKEKVGCVENTVEEVAKSAAKKAGKIVDKAKGPSHRS